MKNVAVSVNVLWVLPFLPLALGCQVYVDGMFSDSRDSGSIKEYPNVIVIYTDDQAQEDIGYFRQLKNASLAKSPTPHIDSLAKEGVALTQFYTAAPVCTPSRVALMTGKKPESAGLVGNAHSKAGLKAEWTMASYFKSLGYRTALVGKWHLGESPEYHPNRKGFDDFFGHISGVVDNYSYVYRWPKHVSRNHRFDLQENGVLREDLQIKGKPVHLAERLMAKANEYIRDSSQPLFMYYAINQPHYPVQPLVAPSYNEGATGDEKADAYYHAFVKTIDHMVGRLLSDLAAAGKLDNTLIVFQSDHGHSFESRNWEGVDSGKEKSRQVFRADHNYSYRGGKFSTFEGGIRVPAMIRFPNTPLFSGYPRNVVRRALAVNIDWLPTLAELVTGKGLPIEYEAEGVDLSSHFLAGDAVKVRDHYFWHHFQRGFTYRWNNFKLLYFPNDSGSSDYLAKNYLPGYYLFNLKENPQEDIAQDLKSVKPDIFEQMRHEAVALFRISCLKHRNLSCSDQDLL